jgi:hypothetical protein
LSIIMLDHDDVASGLVIQYYRTNNDAQVWMIINETFNG